MSSAFMRASSNGFAAILLCSIFGLAGCGDPESDTPLIQSTGSGRIQIERIGVFEDALAYGSKRGIYLIRDTKTEREFIGISGIGISELGSHSSGKSTMSDER